VRIAFARHGRADDRHAGHAVEIGHGAMDADVHLIETLLHAAQPIAAFRDQRSLVTDQRA
jgi:hypothetical protein